MSDAGDHSNRLAGERSTYLRSAAHQTVDWYPWSAEPFEKAKSEGKPVLLDIGASWCHWCHVMDEGTYENKEIAAFINGNFVAVKVDRDERPDVDARYQRAVNAMTGQGGWPLTVFLDDTGRPFYGGTYFPPVSSGDMPGFLDLMKRIHVYYTTRKDEREEVARSVTEAVTAQQRYDQEDVGSAEIRAALMKVMEETDGVNGGFGYAPKFPHTSAIEFLMSMYTQGKKEALEPVKRTLDAMLAGGIHDQLGGGFHRYSTDEKWIVPHFEKMAYDNAGILRNYTHGYQLTGAEEYRKTAYGIVRFIRDNLSGDDGFYASQDADAAPGDDGDYWTWSPSEIASVLEGDELKVAELHYHVHGMAEMHRKDRHVLFRAMSPDDISRNTGIPSPTVVTLLESAKAKMLESRMKRPAPSVDRTVFGNWNGMIASSLFEFYRCFGDRDAYDMAAKNVESYTKNSYMEGKGFRHSLSDSSISGLLEDQVQMLHATLDLFELRGGAGEADIIKNSSALLKGYETATGGLTDVDESVYGGEEIGLSSSRAVQIYDSPSMSSNSAAALLLQRVGAVFEDGAAEDGAAGIARAIAPACVSSGAYTASIFLVVDRMLNGVPVIVVAGKKSDSNMEQLIRAAGGVYLPGKETVVIDTDNADAGIYSATMQSIIQKTRDEGKALAFSCRGRSCSPPVESAEALLSLLSS